MTEAPNETATRRVRPWIAALLTLFGWGVGFYYARRTKAAVWWAISNVLVGLAIIVGVMAYVMLGGRFDPELINLSRWSLLDTVNVSLLIIVATCAWIATAKTKTVPRAGAGRLWGYFAIALIPMFVSLLLGFAIRVAAYQPFTMPSGSMQPAISPGDYFVVSKWSYGYGTYSAAPLVGIFGERRVIGRLPERGDLVVFRPTPDPTRDFIKRLVGLPGDRVQMIGGVLHINGSPVRREPLGDVQVSTFGRAEMVAAYRETLDNGGSYTVLDRGVTELDNTRVFVVPDGHYFLLGDDRDNSADSRVPSIVGTVPYENLIGRVDYIVGQDGNR